MLALAAAAVAVAVRVAGDAAVPPEYPAIDAAMGWDDRVAFAVRYVEQHKGAPYEHPVPVDFLDDAAFEAAYAREDEQVWVATLGDADRRAHEEESRRASDVAAACR